MRVGILFGGPSREREIAFAGGRTIFDNLNKSLFKAVPIFIDSFKHFVLLDWSYIYKGSIRDFYPPVSYLPISEHDYQLYIESITEQKDLDELISRVGRKISPTELSDLIDFAFLSLHGEFGEDGQLQGLLDSLNIPYSGSGVRACAVGMDKSFQKRVMAGAGYASKPVITLSRKDWSKPKFQEWYEQCKSIIGLPLVIRPANQGSSIGVSIVENDNYNQFVKAIDKAFFQLEINKSEWRNLDGKDKIQRMKDLTDIRSSLGFPIKVDGHVFRHPHELLEFLESHFQGINQNHSVLLESIWTEHHVVVEGFIDGREFSCIVVKNESGLPVALPPTEIIKGSEVFDYRSKYLPGLSRKETPIKIENERIEAIRKECERLFIYLGFDVYARIDGFIQNDGTIYLNDPNTTSGMLPSSFFFHQAAEIGLNPSQFITYIIRTSLSDRIRGRNVLNDWKDLLYALDDKIISLRAGEKEKLKVAVIFGGYSFERHISVESGRNVFEKLASSDKYEPTPVFLVGDNQEHHLYQIPINLMLKDNADDIRHKVISYVQDPEKYHHDVTLAIRKQSTDLTTKYSSVNTVFEPKHISYDVLAQQFDAAFIALHGRPGEDGTVQKRLDALGVPYNGSGYNSSQVTINKYETIQILRKHGFSTTQQMLLTNESWTNDSALAIVEVEANFNYPMIFKPVDDGCSSAVKVIKNRDQAIQYLDIIFRTKDPIAALDRKKLNLKHKEEFPRKAVVLIEKKIQAEGAPMFMEVTGGLLTHWKNGEMQFELFEPSEALSGGEVLSLEEKFLAGEGQNITPARFGQKGFDYQKISLSVKSDLERAARILGVEGYARIDAFVRAFDEDNVETIIIEVNSLPGMTPATCIFHQTALNGYTPYDFIDKILEFSIHGQKVKQLE